MSHIYTSEKRSLRRRRRRIYDEVGERNPLNNNKIMKIIDRDRVFVFSLTNRRNNQRADSWERSR
jgi:hypothetical protein